MHPANGDDSNPGTMGRPFRTIQVAVDTAARTKQAVVLRGGNHYLDDTLHYGPQHSGRVRPPLAPPPPPPLTPCGAGCG